MPEENFKMDGFRCSLFSGFGWQAKQAPRVAVLFSGGWILLYTDGDWEGCPDSELTPFADSRILDGAGTRNPQRSGPPRRPKLLAHPATSLPHLGLILPWNRSSHRRVA